MTSDGMGTTNPHTRLKEGAQANLQRARREAEKQIKQSQRVSAQLAASHRHEAEKQRAETRTSQRTSLLVLLLFILMERSRRIDQL